MRIKILFLSIFFASTSHNLIAQQATILKGSLEGIIDNAKVYIVSNSGIKDSCVTKNQQFEFSFKALFQYDLYFIKVKKYPNDSSNYDFQLFLKEGSNTQYNINKNLTFSISGNFMAEEQNSYYTGMSKYYYAIKTLENQIPFTLNPSKLNSLKQQLIEATINSNNYSVDWIKQHITSPFSVAVLRLFVYKGSSLKNKRDTLAERLYDLFPIQALENNYESHVLRSEFASFSYIIPEESELNLSSTSNETNDRYSVVPNNSKAPNFSIKDSSGNAISLEDFKGKYILIDFWASWCGPCRENNPALKNINQQYKDKGLQVLSISMDTDKDAWKKAIIADKMDWLQASDLMGQNLGTGLQYGINAVPEYILIDPNGVILHKSIGGDMTKIRPKLDEIFH